MDEFTEINITPFTDVLLVLLIIFMVMAALIAPAGFEEQFYANCGGLGPEMATRHATLTIARNGTMLLDGETVNDRTIYGALEMMHPRLSRIMLSIEGDKHTGYGHVIRAIDAAKAAGVANVSFVSN